jgi:hydrogenase nickel incorporation protein HypA/HybF
MHELSLAAAMVEQLREVLAREGGGRIVRIDLRIGAMSGVDADAFLFAFPEAARKTPLEGAELVIEEVPLELVCRRCGHRAMTDEPMMICLSCGSVEVDVARGREFTVKSMEVI